MLPGESALVSGQNPIADALLRDFGSHKVLSCASFKNPALPTAESVMAALFISSVVDRSQKGNALCLKSVERARRFQSPGARLAEKLEKIGTVAMILSL